MLWFKVPERRFNVKRSLDFTFGYSSEVYAVQMDGQWLFMTPDALSGRYEWLNEAEARSVVVDCEIVSDDVARQLDAAFDELAPVDPRRAKTRSYSRRKSMDYWNGFRVQTR